MAQQQPGVINISSCSNDSDVIILDDVDGAAKITTLQNAQFAARESQSDVTTDAAVFETESSCLAFRLSLMHYGEKDWQKFAASYKDVKVSF